MSSSVLPYQQPMYRFGVTGPTGPVILPTGATGCGVVASSSYNMLFGLGVLLPILLGIIVFSFLLSRINKSEVKSWFIISIIIIILLIVALLIGLYLLAVNNNLFNSQTTFPS